MSPILFAAAAVIQAAPSDCQPTVGGALTLQAHCRPAPPVVPASEGTGPIGEVVWVAAPRVEYPERAMAQDVRSGQIVLLCNQTPEGLLNGCVVEHETPQGMGFGSATLRAIPRATTAGGEPRVRFTLNFTMR
jgi:hypothetical protein